MPIMYKCYFFEHILTYYNRKYFLSPRLNVNASYIIFTPLIGTNSKDLFSIIILTNIGKINYSR